jgi:hypothetical protein
MRIREALKFAKRGSHSVVADAEVDTNLSDEEKVESMIEQFEEDLALWTE